MKSSFKISQPITFIWIIKNNSEHSYAIPANQFLINILKHQ